MLTIYAHIMNDLTWGIAVTVTSIIVDTATAAPTVACSLAVAKRKRWRRYTLDIVDCAPERIASCGEPEGRWYDTNKSKYLHEGLSSSSRRSSFHVARNRETLT